MSEGPVANYTEDAVTGFGESLPGGMPVVPDLSTEPPPDPPPDPEPEPDPPPEGGDGGETPEAE